MIHLLFTALLVQGTYMDLYRQGLNSIEEGRLREAEVLLERSVSLNPTHIPALRALAESYKKLGRFHEAIEQYKRIIEINPKDISARAHLAELYSWVNDHEKSIVTYRDALELDPDNVGLKTGLARVFRWSHRYDEAERLYGEVLEDHPEDHEALKGLAKTFAMMGDLKRAVETLERAAALYPEDAELFKEMGTVLAWQKDFKKAVKALERAIELNPEYASAYRTLGDVYSWSRKYDRSVESYKKALSIEPENIENHILLAELYMKMGRAHLAEEAVKSALRIDPSDYKALNLLREIRKDAGLPFVRRIGDAFELVALLFVLVLVFFNYRGKKRLLRRRHRVYLYFTDFVLPALFIVTLASIVGRDPLAERFDARLVEDLTEAVLFIALGGSFLALLWSEHRTGEFKETVILAVGAHPDDIELGCGGFIMKAKDNGARVYGLALTKGERGTGRNGDRTEEFRKAARFMELDGFWIMDFEDTALKKRIKDMKDVIEEKVREVGANLVLTHTAIDIHSDHQAVFEATKEGARGTSVLCYEDVSTPREFVPNVFIDISGYMDDKLKLLSFHRTQGDKPYMDPDVIKGRAAHRGLQGGVQYAEAFRAHKLIR